MTGRRRPASLRSGVALLVALAMGAGCAAAPPCEERRPLRVQFLLVNDVYQLAPDARGRGGLARVATLVRGLRREADHTLFVLAGDTLSPSTLSTLVRGRQMIEAWNALGLDLATFGNHEFDWGPPVLVERMRESRFPWVSANVRERGSARPFGGASPWLVYDWSGVRVGVIGLTTPDAADTSRPGPTVGFEPPVASAEAAFDAMGAVHLRAAVTHLPLARDRELAAAVPVHVILGGHDHDPMIHTEGPTVIIKAGADAVNVGRVRYELGCGARVLSRRQHLVPVDARVPEAADVAALVARYAAMEERELDVEVGRTPVAIDAREAVIRREPTPLGRFLAEVMRERVGAEVALLNSGAVRGDRILPPGPLTRRHFRAMLPFSNVIVLVELRGSALLGALERSVDTLPRPTGHYLQTAGIDYRADAARPPGQRVMGVMVRGEPLDPDRLYRVATIEYLAEGKDGYRMLAPARRLLSAVDGPGLVESVFEALAAGRSP
jgi:5'-nucleotidase